MSFNVLNAIKVGLAAGAAAGVLVFLACCWVASLPAVTVVSLSLSFRPWWRTGNWLAASLALVLSAGAAGILAGLRPQVPIREPEDREAR
jgi:hypothetical protein